MTPRSSILRRSHAPSLLVLAILAFGCARDAAAPPVPATVVRAPLAVAERSSASAPIEIPGSVISDRSAAVSSRVLATVTGVLVRLGEVVRQGQVLVTIDPTAAQGQVEQARGALAQAEAGLALARRNFERFQALRTSDAASELEVDLARTAYEQALGAVSQAQGAVAAASSVARESRVVAPFDGRVAAKLVDPGDLAAPGRTLVIIESDRGRQVVASVPESLFVSAAVGLGADLTVSLDARQGRGDVSGTVVEVSPGPDPATHAFTVKLEIRGEGAAGVPTGSAARVIFPGPARPSVWVPERAAIRRGGLDLVVVRGDDGVASTRVVALGLRRADGWIEVLSGLSGGESVALDLDTAPPAGSRLEESSS